jgi:hypothetical protein
VGCRKREFDIRLQDADLLNTSVRLNLGGKTVGIFNAATQDIVVRPEAGDPRDDNGAPQFTLEIETSCGWQQRSAITRESPDGYYFPEFQGLRGIKIYYDNRGGPATPFSIGEIRLDMPANSKGTLSVPTDGCSGTGDAYFQNKLAGQFPYDPDPSANPDNLYFFGTQPGRCYVGRYITYSNSPAPSEGNGADYYVSQQLEPLEFSSLDYFLEKPPDTLNSQYDRTSVVALEECGKGER